MRATTHLAGAVLAVMVVATPRAARCAGPSRARGGLVISVATAGSHPAAHIGKVRGPKTFLGVDSASASSGAVEGVPFFALAIARGSSPHQLSVAPTYEKIGRSRSPGIALSGRF